MDILIIFLSIGINAFFAMSEIGVVSANKTRLQHLMARGSKRAARALELIDAPSRFLSTVQIGITFAGILGAIYGGARLAARLEPAVLAMAGDWAWLQEHAITVCEGVVSLFIGTASIIFGELIPKRLALVFPTQVATGVAGFMFRLSQVASPLIHFLSGTADSLLRLVGVRKNADQAVSEDEVRILIDQGMSSGVFHAGERDMVEGVFALDTLRTGNLMTPRSRMVWINLADSEETIHRRIAASGHSHFPVCNGSEDRVMGMVSVKALWANLSLTGSADVRHLMTEPLTVPLTLSATRLLEVFKQERRHIALVTDEYGSVVGMVSLNDVLESIVGDIPGEMPQHDSYKVLKTADGIWMLDGLMEIGDVEETLEVTITQGRGNDTFHTLAGFLLSLLGRIPKVGEKVNWRGFVFEITAMDRTRIDRVQVTPPAKASEDTPAAGEEGNGDAGVKTED